MGGAISRLNESMLVFIISFFVENFSFALALENYSGIKEKNLIILDR